MLEHIYQRQKDFQRKLYDPDSLSDEDKLNLTKEFTLCLHQELAEVMNSIKWKSYHKYDKIYSVHDTQEELIDCLKFLLNLLIIWDMKPEDILKKFNEKSDIVEKRLK